MIFDDGIMGTLAVMQWAGAEPWQVLEALRPAGIDPDLFMPDWTDAALALAVARRRLRMGRVGMAIPRPTLRRAA